ncbi:MAG TPA: pentapeptide repeat-containing protein [Lacipirellulaceae bacterium]|jgi:uncharacterized protein YjbI with pentapeptide repeats|nr:pentapeptide repeat-containing protein [Lacipirellulaceae bacterium]
MAIASPAFAVVRPRVRLKRTGDVHLIEDVIGEMADTFSTGVIYLAGGVGTGKSTALMHLAAVFAHHDHIRFLDEPTPTELEKHRNDALVVAASARKLSAGVELVLQPWGRDELIEYLLAVHHDDCGSVIARLGAAAKRQWCPQLACIVMDQLAADYELLDASDALVVHVQGLLTGPKQRHAATELSLAMLGGDLDTISKAGDKVAKAGCSAEVVGLLRHQAVQLPLAAARIVGLIHNGCFTDLEKRLPFELIELVGWQCEANSVALNQLRKVMALRRGEAAHAMAASVLHVADPMWRPERPLKPWQFAHGVFRGAQWNGVNFFRASLMDCDFSNADLHSAGFESANISEANFSGATLRHAEMDRANASLGCFHAADLTRAKLCRATFTNGDLTNVDLSHATMSIADLNGANLSEAVLRGADLSQASLINTNLSNADFTDAVLTEADLSSADLRTACLSGACLEKAILRDVQLEDVQLLHARFQGANLRNAHLTGSVFPSADLRGADLRGAGLAEIDWEEADLRNADLSGASFHMGSSRSGLVSSPYACEGSKTGFYTDDLEDLTFKRPEEVRKANLRGADLRGMKAAGVDFYLVDLRDAKLDVALREQARDSGAILNDHVE